MEKSHVRNNCDGYHPPRWLPRLPHPPPPKKIRRRQQKMAHSPKSRVRATCDSQRSNQLPIIRGLSNRIFLSFWIFKFSHPLAQPKEARGNVSPIGVPQRPIIQKKAKTGDFSGAGSPRERPGKKSLASRTTGAKVSHTIPGRRGAV